MSGCPRTIDPERLRRCLDYDEGTGEFRWRVTLASRAPAGSVAGSLQADTGYVRIWIDRVGYYAHRLAVVWMTGLQPSEVDHADGDRANNRWSNLRVCDRAQNTMNSRKRDGSASKFRGVYREQDRWRARIFVEGRNRHLGYFATEPEAAAAYVAAAREHFGEFARVG